MVERLAPAVPTLPGSVFSRGRRKYNVNDFYKNIPGWFNYADVYDRVVAKATDGAHFVEVGSYFGRSACYMAQKIKDSGKKIKFDCVDIFQAFDRGKLRDTRKLRTQRALIVAHGSVLDAFKVFMSQAEVSELVNPIQLDSLSASQLYEDHSLDFVWIDADHSYAAVMADLQAWSKKMKPGGTLAGHDYNRKDVARAVTEFFGKKHKPISRSSWIATAL